MPLNPSMACKLCQVLTVVFRSIGKQFSGATQLLPTGLSAEQSQKALQAFCQAFKTMYCQSGQVPSIPQKIDFGWKEFRVPTKNMLMGISNALVQIMPPDFTLQKCIPPVCLVPRATQADRLLLTDDEKTMLGLGPWAKDCDLYFVYNYASQTCFVDFIEDNDFYKLCFSADEGTEDRVGS